MSKQTYPAYRAMAFTDTERGDVVTLLDTWHETPDAALSDAQNMAAKGWRAVVYLEAKTDAHTVTESTYWESEPGTSAWLDSHDPETEY
jgi:heme-degrading monooxygenase HmoA